MACYHPVKAWRSRSVNESGKRPLVFRLQDGFADLPVVVPCGQCIGCRVARQRAWAVRLLHEASTSTASSFLTLTYRDTEVPYGLVPTLAPLDVTLFLKRLRLEIGPVRYFVCGEYGERGDRPHYHMLLYGYDFPDRKYWCTTGGNKLFRSALLEKVWPFGNSLIGSVSTASAQYVAKYTVKKVRGARAEAHYLGREPEFARMSRRPGIGSAWVEKFGRGLFPRDFVVVPGGKKVAVPRYYLEKADECVRRRVKNARKRAQEGNPENEPERLSGREVYAEAIEARAVLLKKERCL